ncbi:uncharacterized protein EI90DRAFT_3022949 [Cantharellus anzutake]|uniref:uncharacterized protein n=1 Tax=Cantharellus anzutake TaxID=1750568 RepID=UPI0019079473|nr:uncharacterized protein EI90DRAFT_3022949 [Cantharellus anzutake]KAF8312593.1 hypothetical protein EI90DRAFT_3022949 [Cantharellus anzutake]
MERDLLAANPIPSLLNLSHHVPKVPGIDGCVGVVLIAATLSACIFGVLNVQAFHYFSRFPNDPTWLKVTVSLVCIVQLLRPSSQDFTVGTTGSSWEIALMSYILEPIIALVVQLFFARRTWRLNRRTWFMGMVIVLVALLSFALGEFACITTFRLRLFSEYERYKYQVTVWLFSSAACDVMITATVCWVLWASKTGFSETDHFISRMIVWVINTAALTSTVAILDAVTFLAYPNELIHVGLNYLLAKLYTSTLLASLNRRRSQVGLTCPGRPQLYGSLKSESDVEMQRSDLARLGLKPMPSALLNTSTSVHLSRNPSSKPHPCPQQLNSFGPESRFQAKELASGPTVSTVVSVFDDEVIGSLATPTRSSSMKSNKSRNSSAGLPTIWDASHDEISNGELTLVQIIIGRRSKTSP